MTDIETAGILSVLEAAYPQFYRNTSVEQANAMVDLWATMLAGYNFDTVAAAIRRYISRDTAFPPSPGQILGILEPPEKAYAIWNEAQRLLLSGIPPDDAETAYNRMSETCKNAVMAVGGWLALSMANEGDVFMQRAFVKAVEQTASGQSRPSLHCAPVGNPRLEWGVFDG